MSSTSRSTVVALAAALALTGCAPGSPADEPPPAADDQSTTDPLDCLVGGPWDLDLADYAAQAEPWMAGLGIPISDFTMSGRQTVQFTVRTAVPPLRNISRQAQTGGLCVMRGK